jgi:hypothetical protein
MTITVTVQKLGTTAIADVDLVGLDQTKLEFVTTTKSPRQETTEYVLADGSAAYKVSVFVSREFSPKANDGFGETQFSITLAARQTTEDSVLLTLENYPTWYKQSWACPGDNIADVAETRQALNNVFALGFPSVAAGVINDGFLTKLAWGVTRLFG